jgi:glycosyltransferase involved in cell wall biosynthesis
MAEGIDRHHCMVGHIYYPNDVRVEREAQALIAKGIEVDLICLRRSNESSQEVVDGVYVYRTPLGRFRSKKFIAQLFEYLAFFTLAVIRLTGLYFKRHYDVIQVHNLPDFLVFVALIPKLNGAKVILDLHDLMPEFYAERSQSSMDSLFVRFICWQESISCRFADHVITVTDLWRNTLINRGQPPSKVSVVMNTADERIFNRELGGFPKKDGGIFNLFYHGTMAYRSGLDLLIMAIDQIRHTASDIRLTLHGGGEYRKVLKNLVEEMDLHTYINFSDGGLPTADLPNIILKADLAVVPYRDGVFSGDIFPTKVMEYAALGIPTIASKTTAISEYFDETAILFFTPENIDELANCILILYRDRNRLADLAQNITKFNELYNWEDQKASYYRCIEKLFE